MAHRKDKGGAPRRGNSVRFLMRWVLAKWHENQCDVRKMMMKGLFYLALLIASVDAECPPSLRSSSHAKAGCASRYGYGRSVYDLKHLRGGRSIERIHLDQDHLSRVQRDSSNNAQYWGIRGGAVTGKKVASSASTTKKAASFVAFAAGLVVAWPHILDFYQRMPSLKPLINDMISPLKEHPLGPLIFFLGFVVYSSLGLR